MHRIRSRLTYANVMSSIAAFGVLAGGGAYAQQRVTTSDLANRAVTTPKVAPQAIGTGKLKRRAVGTAKIKPRAVGGGKLRLGGVTRPTLADGAVDATKILDGAIHRTKLATDAVGTNELADRAVTTTKINPGAVGAARLADGAVTRAKLHDNMRPYTAVVDDTGALQRGRGVFGSVQAGTGEYAVHFQHDVSSCAWLATRGTAASTPPDGDRTSPSVYQPADAPEFLIVQTWDLDGDPADDEFHLSVVC